MKLFSLIFCTLLSSYILGQNNYISIQYQNQDSTPSTNGKVFVITPDNQKIHLQLSKKGIIETVLPKGNYTIIYNLGHSNDTCLFTTNINDSLVFNRVIKPKKVKTLNDINILADSVGTLSTVKTSTLRTYEFAAAEKVSAEGRKRYKKDRSLKKEPSKAILHSPDDFRESFEAAPSSSLISENTQAGTLTAGELNDFSKWDLWTDIQSTDLANFNKTWGIFPKNRICVQVTNQDGLSVVNAKVELLDNDESIFSTYSDNTGKAELWLGLYSDQIKPRLRINITYENQTQTFKNPKTFNKGINFYAVNANCEASKNVDIAFIVDATGSMGDEINYLKAELLDVIKRVENINTELDLRTGCVFYRDNTDDYTTKINSLTKNINKTKDFISQQFAGGGGDFPEAVDDALITATQTLNWRTNTRAKIAFLILDAPPHENPENISKIKKAVFTAAEKGIRIIPIVGSGINKSTEYLMRSIALATNGTYSFLTDDSGVGGKHIKPTTDDYEVEKLNDLMVRLITQFSEVADCDFVIDNDTTPQQEQWNIKTTENIELTFYPNPTKGQINITSSTKLEAIYISDLTGKSIVKLNGNDKTTWNYDLSNYPPGTYFIRYYDSNLDRWFSKQLILIK